MHLAGVLETKKQILESNRREYQRMDTYIGALYDSLSKPKAYIHEIYPLNIQNGDLVIFRGHGFDFDGQPTVVLFENVFPHVTVEHVLIPKVCLGKLCGRRRSLGGSSSARGASTFRGRYVRRFSVLDRIPSAR